MTIQRMLAKTVGTATLCVLFTLTALSQTKTITGKVTDDKSAPLQGATVAAKGTKRGVSTSADGSFSINIPASVNTLTISSIGYAPQDISIEGQTSVTISLVPSTQGLNEVVVVGYGTARKKDVTGSLVSVKSKDFNQGVVTSPDQLLTGKVSGMEITTSSGQPGAATVIKIRGNNSIRVNNNPLYVIDGVPLDGRTARPSLDLGQNGLDFGPTPETNPLLYINPNDIAQIDVLKDASSAAIYGSRGANGVIVITTKHATGTGTKLEFNTSFASNIGYMKKFHVMNAGEFRAGLKKYNLGFDSLASVDAQKAISTHKLSQSYSLALSGGNDNGRFRVSFLGSRNNGLIKKTSLDKYLGNFDGQYKFLDKRISLDFNLIAGHTTENLQLLSNTAGAGGNLMSYALNWNPTKSFYTKSGSYSGTANSFSAVNPLAVIDGFSDVANVNVFLGNISATVNIVKGLDYKFLYAINHGTGTRNMNADGWVDGLKGVSGKGFAAINTAILTSQTFTHTLSYNTDLTDALRLNAVAGYEYWKTSYTTTALGATQFNINLDYNTRVPVKYSSFMGNAGVQFPLITAADPKTEIQSYFGRVNLVWMDKYYLTATLRADGSNKFGSKNKYGYFPSVGVKWSLTGEEFLKNSTVFNNLSLRASYGITGNQEFPAGAALEQFSSTSYNSITQTNVANPDLKWEKTTSIDIGVEYGFAKNRVYGTIDYYHKNTTNLLFQSTAIQPAPSSIYFINLPAHLLNSGIEFSIGAAIVQERDFSWDAGFNLAYNKNKLTQFKQAPIPTARVDGNGVSGALAQIIDNNQPVNEFYLKPFRGFDQNGQQIIGDTAMYSGDPNPHVLMGLASTVRYKKLSLTVNFNSATGYKIYNNTHNTITNIGQFAKGLNSSAADINTKESINDGVAASSRYLENGNFVKLRNATLSYNFGDVANGKVKNLSVFVSGTNLFVITKFTGFDPEVNVDKTNNNYPSRNMEYIPYPTPRTISFGLNLGL